MDGSTLWQPAGNAGRILIIKVHHVWLVALIRMGGLPHSNRSAATLRLKVHAVRVGAGHMTAPANISPNTRGFGKLVARGVEIKVEDVMRHNFLPCLIMRR